MATGYGILGDGLRLAWFRALLLCATVGGSGCELSSVLIDPRVEEPVWKLTGPTMGTRYAVSVVGGDELAAGRLRDRIDSRLIGINRLMSTYDPQSELSRFNASESVAWFAVSPETAEVTAAALSLAADSGGAYDPTVGPLVDLWGFGPGEDRTDPPTAEEIEGVQASIGYAGVETRLDPPALRKREPGTRLDLSSIAKGHGVDAVAELLTESGVEAYMVEIGGEVRTRGRKPGGGPWRIGVERADEPLPPQAGKQRLQRVVELVGKSMATSGDYRNYFEHEGVRYSHTIDPKSGRPVEHDLATVTVVAESCREADGLATALLVLGPSEGYDWAAERGVAALFVRRKETNQLIERATPAWDKTTAEEANP